ncbi:thiolase-like protein [Dunaliella salina]|uniref:beta-ketoacyl-[acyl-carrier-protein] synthase I n=1 Tax=Dunaliella salina TaxID=3046 RepID=A0ABQ7GXN4_DUNSA|nr:thiolase-like protein [Dunaliella salina]|eukprot:KAF5839371.1 thiolase-like protein [Dunaliella salina]
MHVLKAPVRALAQRGMRYMAHLPPPPTTSPCHGVVVTGLGCISPLGFGVADSWAALLAGKTGTRKLEAHHLPPLHSHLLPQLPCKVAALVPPEQCEEALGTLDKEDRSKRSSLFMQYALLAAHEALSDAGLLPELANPRLRATTGVAIGTGMSSCNEIIEAWQLLVVDKMRRLSPFFVPKILPNMAAGAVGIK